MSDHTPSLDQVRGRYCDGTLVQTGHVTDGHEFDRMIAKVRAEAKQEALREAADLLAPNGILWWGDLGVRVSEKPFDPPHVSLDDWLRARSDKLDTL